MRLREALVRSRNLVSIRVMNALGPAYATQYIERFGFSKDSLPRNLSLALGTASVSPLEMARAYAVFANGGFKVEPYYLDRIISPDGKSLYEAQPRFACPECLQSPNASTSSGETFGEGGSDAPIRAPSTDEMRWGGLTYLQEQWLAPAVISPQNDYLMTDMMSDVIRRGTATRALQLKRGDLAGKTGTTNDRRDTWFCGFNAGLVAAAWVGFDQERSLGPGEEGGRTALPMWVYFMAEALKGVPEQRRPAPPGLVSMRISADTGLAARPGEPNAIFETFMAGHLPAEPQLDSTLGESQEGADDKKEDDSLF
jgi:penicillin-binding protein 1A